MSDRIVRIRIALKDIEPEIWRRVELPLDFTLEGLHDVIQAVMGWQNYHLYEFTVAGKRYGVPNPEFDYGRKILQARLAKLQTFVDQGVGAFDYAYDMGNNWQHIITIEAIAIADPNIGYPRFIDGARRGPPEDVGSIPGYYDFLDAVSKPRHRERKRMLEWYGGPYDPDDIDERTLCLRLGDIARRYYSRKLVYRRHHSA